MAKRKDDALPSHKSGSVFISWSGEQSQAVAKLLRPWIERVIQVSRPWMSDSDVEAGARWSPEIAEALNASSIGIICVTSENKDRPWLNFEAGALSKSLTQKARVCPYLIGMGKADVTGPLSQFQCQTADQEGTFRVIESVNRAIGKPVEKGPLRESFDKWWPELQQDMANVSTGDKVPPRADREILEEVLELLRSMVDEEPKTSFMIMEEDNARLLLAHLRRVGGSAKLRHLKLSEFSTKSSGFFSLTQAINRIVTGGLATIENDELHLKNY